jgi:hypothetical protein
VRLWHWVRPNLSQPLFLVGAPRSGTTFLGEALAALPELSYHYEPPIVKAAARYTYQGSWSPRKARWVYRMTYAWLMRRHFDGDLHFAEKTPQNCFVIDTLHHCFPDARFVHILRDGRDAAVSYRRQPWLASESADSGRRESGGYPIGPYARFWVEPGRCAEFESTDDLHRCIWAWRRHAESALAQLAPLPTALRHELRYEELVSNSRAEGERLLDFLEIERPESRGALHRQLEGARKDSIGVWRRELGAGELATIEREAGALLQRLDYR